ncbi:hypothetical protein AAHA92_05602 [Salvia divinorum]|uniref:Uncharacterized protein n=1 Tax=Salvia divinorum TaxID=28513 RepID=A0ABD1I543_SALDI
MHLLLLNSNCKSLRKSTFIHLLHFEEVNVFAPPSPQGKLENFEEVIVSASPQPQIKLHNISAPPPLPSPAIVFIIGPAISSSYLSNPSRHRTATPPALDSLSLLPLSPAIFEEVNVSALPPPQDNMEISEQVDVSAPPPPQGKVQSNVSVSKATTQIFENPGTENSTTQS